MPKFIVNTNINKDKVPGSFARELTQQLSKALGKPAQYLAIQISLNHVMSFGGSTDPCAMCFLCSIGKIGEQEDKELKIPSDRIHISFCHLSPGNVGWHETPFA